MAVIDWPSEFGYAEISEMPERSRGPHVHRSVFTGKPHVSYGGGRRRRGYVVTPIANTGQTQALITSLVQKLSDPVNQLRLERPWVSGAPERMTVHITRIQPPERDDRGIWRGWRLEFISIGDWEGNLDDDRLPEILEELASDLPLLEIGDIRGSADRDTYDFEIAMSTYVFAILDCLSQGPAGDVGYEIISPGIVVPVAFRQSSPVGAPVFGGALLPPGNYQVQVGLHTDSATDTDYRLRVFEPDFVGLPLSASGRMQGAGKRDLYPFDLPVDSQVTARMTGMTSGSAGDIGMDMRRSNGGVAVSTGGSTSGGRSQTTNGSDIQIRQSYPAGNYILMVGFHTDSDTDTSYELSIEATPV